MATWLTGPAVVGLALEAFSIVVRDVATPAAPFFSLFIVLWGTLMLEYWKRAQSLQGGWVGARLG